ncbi:DUF397 domain-containing protein [Kitasatospora sp. NPDC048722]|uniref:DUF397 domain-containing protein n=1 Tax=Kitasatospora sp. NPDC048722 TaxID=3155639 RepID=UPI0033CD0D49
MDDLRSAVWRKSSYSAQQGQCIEVAIGGRGGVPVRDSKDPQGPVLVFPAPAWASFLSGLQVGDFSER